MPGMQKTGGGGSRAGTAAAVGVRGVTAASGDAMLFGEIFAVALGALRANKLRSVLTMLGIVIGVAAVIAMVALGTRRAERGEGAHHVARHDAAHGQPGQQRGERGVASVADRARLTMKDAAALEERAPHRGGAAGDDRAACRCST